MSVSDNEHLLPAIASQDPTLISMGELIGVSDDILSLTLVGSESAIERAQLFDMNGEKLWFAQPDHPEPQESTVTVRNPHTDSLDYRVPREGSVHTSSVNIGIDTIWARNKVGLQAKLLQRKQYEEAKAALVRRHPLGAGGLVVANEFGGMDYENPESTAKHLVLRAIIAKQAQLKAHFPHSDYGVTTEFIEAGLLHPLLGKAIGTDFMQFIEDVGKILDTVDLLPEAAKEHARPALLEGATEQGRLFLEKHRETIAMAAHVAQNPDLATDLAKNAKWAIQERNGTWAYRLGNLAISEQLAVPRLQQ